LLSGILNQIEELIDKAIKLKKDENYESALNILEDLFNKEPRSENVKNAFIEVLFDYGGYLNDDWTLKYDKAVECYKKIISLDSRNYRAWYSLGVAYHNLQKIEEALSSYVEALKIKPNHAFCYYNMGLIYEIHKEDLEKALKLYEKALNYDANFVYASQARDDVKKKLNDLKLSQIKDTKEKFDLEDIF